MVHQSRWGIRDKVKMAQPNNTKILDATWGQMEMVQQNENMCLG